MKRDKLYLYLFLPDAFFFGAMVRKLDELGLDLNENLVVPLEDPEKWFMNHCDKENFRHYIVFHTKDGQIKFSIRVNMPDEDETGKHEEHREINYPDLDTLHQSFLEPVSLNKTYQLYLSGGLFTMEAKNSAWKTQIPLVNLVEAVEKLTGKVLCYPSIS